MESGLGLLASLLAAALIIAPIVLFIRQIYRRQAKRLALLNSGQVGVGRVVSAAQTGLSINGQPEMRVAIRSTDGAASGVVEAVQIVDLGDMPRPGDEVDFVYDLNTPRKALLTGIYYGEAGARSRNALKPLSPAHQQALSRLRPDLLPPPEAVAPTQAPARDDALPPEGELHLATVIAPPSGVAESIVNLELEAVGQPPRRAVARPPRDRRLAPGERVQVWVDPNRPGRATILPLP